LSDSSLSLAPRMGYITKGNHQAMEIAFFLPMMISDVVYPASEIRVLGPCAPADDAQRSDVVYSSEPSSFTLQCSTSVREMDPKGPDCHIGLGLWPHGDRRPRRRAQTAKNESGLAIWAISR
jgi:hypothetical protein